MTEQEYKELTEEVKHSGMPLKSQKEIQRLIDKEYIENEEKQED